MMRNIRTSCSLKRLDSSFPDMSSSSEKGGLWLRLFCYSSGNVILHDPALSYYCYWWWMGIKGRKIFWMGSFNEKWLSSITFCTFFPQGFESFPLPKSSSRHWRRWNSWFSCCLMLKLSKDLLGFCLSTSVSKNVKLYHAAPSEASVLYQWLNICSGRTDSTSQCCWRAARLINQS